MTIAAGFCYDGGILLCADSLYTGGMKLHQTKLFPFQHSDGCVAFALAGNEGYGKFAIQEAQDAILASPEPEKSVKTVKRLLGKILKSVYSQHIDTRPQNEQYESQISLLVGLWNRREGFRLLATRKTVAIEINTYDCIGSGEYLGHYIIAPAYESKITRRQSVVLALQAMAAVKDHDPSCGGQSEFLAISEGGKMTPLNFPPLHNSIRDAEDCIRDFQSITRSLLFHLTDPALKDDQFAEHMDRCKIALLQMVRHRWKVASRYGGDILTGEPFPQEEWEDHA